jgi:hypothetical protein
MSRRTRDPTRHTRAYPVRGLPGNPLLARNEPELIIRQARQIRRAVFANANLTNANANLLAVLTTVAPARMQIFVDLDIHDLNNLSLVSRAFQQRLQPDKNNLQAAPVELSCEGSIIVPRRYQQILNYRFPPGNGAAVPDYLQWNWAYDFNPKVADYSIDRPNNMARCPHTNRNH